MGLFRNKQWKYLVIAIATLGFIACTPFQAEQSWQGETRLVKHAMGETEVPQEPKRVVPIDSSALEDCLALEASLVGGATTDTMVVDDNSGISEELKEKARQITDVGHQTQPNLETILSLEPDLILGNKSYQEDIYSKLSQIAPTVFKQATGGHWKENLPKHAEALGKVEQGEKLMEEYYQRLENFQEQMGERLETMKVAVVRFRPGNLRFYMKDSSFGLILQDAGISFVEGLDKDKSFEDVSFEQIPTLEEADVILFTEDDDSIKERVTNHPLWSKLKAVRQGNVYQLSDYEVGILSANLMIDDLFKYLVNSEQ